MVSEWTPGVIGGLLYQAHQVARTATNQALRPDGVELRHLGVLGLVARGGPQNQRQLGEALSLDKSTMVRIIDELERLGLAERRPAAHDRRIYQITITTAGRERLDAGNQRANAVMGDLLSVFDPSERVALYQLLARFVAHARGRATPDMSGCDESLPQQRSSATGDLDDASTPAGP